jgi:NitT/TauT family transport system permease protein
MSSRRHEPEASSDLEHEIDVDQGRAYAVEQALAYGDTADVVATSADHGLEAAVGGWRSPAGRFLRTALGISLFLIGAALVWEGFKWLAGDPWRFPALGYEHRPPFRLLQAQDLQLPHLWDIASALLEPVQRNADQSLGQFLVGAAFVTWVEAAIGFVVGTFVGILLATVFVHSLPAERALVPYVIASQTIPIIALAPLLIEGLGRGLASVVFIAAYLTFFPVTIAAMRGLRSPDPRALELMRSYAASPWHAYWKVRLPASLPYLFTAFKIAATASVVGAIIGEDPAGTANGLGRAIVNFNQQYVSGPEKLWATILIAGLAGIAFYLLVRIVEVYALRHRTPGTS